MSFEMEKEVWLESFKNDFEEEEECLTSFNNDFEMEKEEWLESFKKDFEMQEEECLIFFKLNTNTKLLKEDWLESFKNNIENYDKYKILNIDSTCYTIHPCKHYTTILFNNQVYEVSMSGVQIYKYQKYHNELTAHFSEYKSF